MNVGYRPRWFVADALTGLTVASMAIPQCMAVAQLAGVPAVTGLYAVMPAMVLYGLFGASHPVATGPEPTLAALFAPILAPLAAGDPAHYLALAGAMALLSGAILVLASILRLGFMADFLPRAVVLGYVNGVALVLTIDQLGALSGMPLEATGTVPAVVELVRRIDEVHVLTLIVGGTALVIVATLRKLVARFPGALLVVIAAAIAVALFDLERCGVRVVGPIPPGLPRPQLPRIGLGDLVDLIPGALAAAVLIFSDGVITARAVARPDNVIDDDRELRGYGAACLGAGLVQGFPVGVSASRTVVAVSAGARTQVFGWVAAMAIALVLLFLTGPLRFIPRTALAAVIISAAITLFDFKAFAWMWRVQRIEAVLASITVVAVLVLGLLPAVGLGVIIALGVLIHRTARPHHAVLGAAHGVDGFHDIARYEDAQTEPGLIAYRFDAPLFSANAEYLYDEVLALLDHSLTPVRCFVLDAEAISSIDTAALAMLSQLARLLRSRGTSFVFARVKGPVRDVFERAGLVDEVGTGSLFPTVTAAVEAFRAQHRDGDAMRRGAGR